MGHLEVEPGFVHQCKTWIFLESNPVALSSWSPSTGRVVCWVLHQEHVPEALVLYCLVHTTLVPGPILRMSLCPENTAQTCPLEFCLARQDFSTWALLCGLGTGTGLAPTITSKSLSLSVVTTSNHWEGLWKVWLWGPTSFNNHVVCSAGSRTCPLTVYYLKLKTSLKDGHHRVFLHIRKLNLTANLPKIHS